jgi:hypothetical protein
MVMNGAFSRSMSYWRIVVAVARAGWSYEVHGDLKNRSRDLVRQNLIEGDCLARIHTPRDAIIHIQAAI